jgi:hypothetical protein
MCLGNFLKLNLRYTRRCAVYLVKEDGWKVISERDVTELHYEYQDKKAAGGDAMDTA